jgi:hypothetical protein
LLAGASAAGCLPDPPHDPAPPGGPCPAGETYCEPICVDLQSDRTNCGACDFDCGFYSFCLDGECSCGCVDDIDCDGPCLCEPGRLDCDGDGVNEGSDCVCGA